MSYELDDALLYIDTKFITMSVRLNFLTERLAQFEERINKLEEEKEESKIPKHAYYYCLNTGELTKVQSIVFSSKLFLECPCDICKKNRSN